MSDCCIVDIYSSRVCEKGTKCCNVKHGGANVVSPSDHRERVERFVMPKFKWTHFPENSPFCVVECDMILPFGKTYICRLHNADFMPPINNGYIQRTHEDVENEMWQKFLRFIGGA